MRQGVLYCLRLFGPGQVGIQVECVFYQPPQLIAISAVGDGGLEMATLIEVDVVHLSVVLD
jgi:hypothetical protein